MDSWLCSRDYISRISGLSVTVCSWPKRILLASTRANTRRFALLLETGKKETRNQIELSLLYSSRKLQKKRIYGQEVNLYRNPWRKLLRKPRGRITWERCGVFSLPGKDYNPTILHLAYFLNSKFLFQYITHSWPLTHTTPLVPYRTQNDLMMG